MHDIGVAIAGTGFMGWVHIEALRRVGVRLEGVCGSSAKKSQAAAEQFGLPKAYESFGDLLADDRVDAVHIGTPNRLHFEMASQALRAGKHVLCEKPLAMTAAESRELVRIAREHPKLAAGVNYNIRYYPLCIEARDRVRNGDLGDVFHLSGSYVQDWLLYATDYNWRVLSDEGGELRAVSDIGTHCLDLVTNITGLQIDSLCADLSTVHPKRERPSGEVQTFTGKNAAPADTSSVDISTEDYGAVLVRFKGGARGVLHVSQVSAGRKNCLRFEIAGSKQSMAWNSEDPNRLWLGRRDGSNGELLRDPALLTASAAQFANYPGGHNEGYADSFKQCFRDFYEYIRAGDFESPEPFPTFADGHREIVFCDAVLQSHREERWVNIENDD